jgi:hypothetical protein
MRLPDYFPQRAGQAHNALRFQLAEYTKTIQKIVEEKVPTTMEETIEPTLARSLQKYLAKRRQRKELTRKVEEYVKVDASMYLVCRSSYPAKRRNAMGELPGFHNHYPNRLYTAPALPWFTFGRIENEVKRSLVGSLFGKKVQDTTVLAAVGRRVVVEHQPAHGTALDANMGRPSSSPPPGECGPGNDRPDTANSRPGTGGSNVPWLALPSPMTSSQLGNSPMRSSNTNRAMLTPSSNRMQGTNLMAPSARSSMHQGVPRTSMHHSMHVPNRPTNLIIPAAGGGGSARPSPMGAAGLLSQHTPTHGHQSATTPNTRPSSQPSQQQLGQAAGPGARRPSYTQPPMLGALGNRGKQPSQRGSARPSHHANGSSASINANTPIESTRRTSAASLSQAAQMLQARQHAITSGAGTPATRRKSSSSHVGPVSAAATFLTASIRSNNSQAHRTSRSSAMGSSSRVLPNLPDDADYGEPALEDPFANYLDEHGNIISGFEQSSDHRDGSVFGNLLGR